MIPLAISREKSYVRSSFPFELAMIFAFDSIVSCISSTNDINIVQRINIHRLRWLSHVVRMKEDGPARRVFDVEKVGEENDLASLKRYFQYSFIHTADSNIIFIGTTIQFVYYFNKQSINSRITNSWRHSRQIDKASSHQILEKKIVKKIKIHGNR